MPLKLTLRPDERIVVNGCMMRNSSRRHVLTIESHADVVRGHDLLDEDTPATPVTRAYFLIQTALIQKQLRDELQPLIHDHLAALATTFGHPSLGHVFKAANYVSVRDYYKALRELRPVIEHEAKLFDMIAAREKGEGAATMPRPEPPSPEWRALG